ncbi:hypothetical protein ACSVDE_01665 [Pseudalkalibacillus sp. Hm43]|uniref:hypothetical protein n=1 Tax=Pseudalkalibacillus sp. Hm43 TaxID=3450742 RepID=UPI003F42AAAC
MNKTFKKLFWGFLFVLVEIHLFVIDILPDPIGYLFIYLGLLEIRDTYGKSNLSRPISMILLVVSVPTVFINQSNVNESALFMQLNGLEFYEYGLGLAKLVLTFYVFKLLVNVAEEIGDIELKQYTQKLFNIYIVLMLIFQIAHAFFMNMYGDLLAGAIIASAILSIVLDIFFLVLLRRFGKKEGRTGEGRSKETVQV